METGGGPGGGAGAGAAAVAGRGAASGRGAAHAPLAALLAIVSPRTWLAVIHLLAGLIIGLVSFTVVLAGLTAGVGLLAAFLIGVPVLVATFWVAGRLAALERARFALLLGRRIPTPVPAPVRSGWRRLLDLVATPAGWRYVSYALVRLPLSGLEAVVAVLVWAAAFTLLGLPVYNSSLPTGAAHLGHLRVHGSTELAWAVLAGALLLLAAPQVTRMLAAGDAVLAGWLLKPGHHADLTARIGELETSRARVVDSAEAQRRRIERDLHDGAQQRLVSLAMELGRARAKFATDPAAAEAIVGQAHEQAKEALAELRNLVRGVHPPVLSDRGLDAALSGLAALCPVPVTVRAGQARRPPPAVEAIAYFVVAEALTNVAKHARASHAEVTVTGTADRLRIVISDDGIGGADPAGQGLSGLADRVAGVDGSLTVDSPAGGPTRIEVVLPCGW